MSRPSHADPNTAKYREKCNNIIGISSRIRYTGVMNKFGRTLAGTMRKGIVPLLGPEDAKSEYFIEAARNQMRRNFEKSIGKTEYTFTENEKVKILTLADTENFYYITMDKETSGEEVSKIIVSARDLVSGG